MKPTKSIGRMVGLLLLLHMAAGLTVPFILLQGLSRSGSFLSNAAQHPVLFRTAVLLLFLGSAIPIGIAITALPVLRRYSNGMAFWLLALAIAGCASQSVDNSALMSMLRLSQEYAGAGVAERGLYETVGMVVGSARGGTHYAYLLAVGSWIVLLWSVILRFRLVPRVLAGFGLVTSLLQVIGVPLRGLLGYQPIPEMAMPLAPAYLALAIWLIIKGFDERQPLSPDPAF